MKIIVAPDSFKGSLTARQAATAMGRGARQVCPEAEIVLMPLADGGEGTAEALVTMTGGRRCERQVTGPLGAPVTATFGLLGPDFGTAVVEMAQAAGLGLVPPSQRDPRVTTTFGVGKLLREAAETGARRIFIGLGGSATNDGGAGAMTALGARFLDGNGQPLAPGGAALARLARVDLSNFHFPTQVSVVAASDVRNPLTGPNGASAVFGPQKGADAAAAAELDAALAHYARVLHRDLGQDIAQRPGAGAAGGLGAALMAFLGAEFQPGIDLVLDVGGFDAQAQSADIVLTGEGKIDAQTLSGKVIHGLLRRCRRANVPLLAFGGAADPEAVAALRAHGLADAFALVAGSVTLEDALREPEQVLEKSVAQALSHTMLG